MEEGEEKDEEKKGLKARDNGESTWGYFKWIRELENNCIQLQINRGVSD